MSVKDKDLRLEQAKKELDNFFLELENSSLKVQDNDEYKSIKTATSPKHSQSSVKHSPIKSPEKCVERESPVKKRNDELFNQHDEKNDQHSIFKRNRLHFEK